MAETYVVLTSREHCLRRADMYIGSTTPQETEYWDFVQKEGSYDVELKRATVPPAMTQLFLEIATNATDQAARPGSNVRNIKVDMNAETGEISVWNDGLSIPVRRHQQMADKYLTTVIFSEFRCGSNFNDEQKRTGAGRNGYGAKCTNAWSKKFVVEHCDGAHHFKQTWRDNLLVEEAPKVKASARKSTFTKVSFVLDFARLGVQDVAGAIAYLRTFVWHLCPVTDSKLNIYLDGQRLPVRNLRDYARILAPDASAVVYDEGTNIQVAVCPVRPGFPNTVGFVNAIPCNAGTHINYAINRIKDVLKKSLKDCNTGILRANMIILVNATVVNPTFTSQTKEQLSLDMRRSGASWTPSDTFVRNFKRSPVVEAVRLDHELRETRKAKLESGKGTSSRARVVNVEGYESANNAGRTNRRVPCTLILTEGLSAKGFVVAGLPNRDNYGIFPLRGKLKNVRGEKLSTVLKVAEISNVLKILGVDLSQPRPTKTSQLRYDRVCFCTDQDVDGAHITGLGINALACLLPEILQSTPQFVQRLATPLVRAWPKRGGDKQVREFMSEPEFDAWFGRLSDDNKRKYEVKYFKGLGTSTARDAKQCFSQLDKYLITIDCTGPDSMECLADFFDSTRVERRKALMSSIETFPIDYKRTVISLQEYLMGEVLPFFHYDNERSIAHVVDGFKPAQRKLMWVLSTTYGERVTPNIKVAQLSGEVAKLTHYKHGEESLSGTTVRMAQDYPICGNNLNLLVPEGMYGNRHGDDPASPRYIYTCAERIAQYIFPAADVPVLDILESEGHAIEPRYMVPVIPMVLCNGTSGTGTGWSSDVASYDPASIIAWCRAYNNSLRSGEVCEPLRLKPYLEGFEGTVTDQGDGKYIFRGVMKQTDARTVHVTDLPVSTSSFLWSEKKKSDVKFKEAHPLHTTIASTDVTVDLKVRFGDDVEPALLTKLQARASASVSCNNMNLWDVEGFSPVKFKTIDDIARKHAEVRLRFNEKRRVYQIGELEQHIAKMSNQYRFVVQVMETPALLFGRSDEQVTADLERDGYDRFDGSYDYLLKLPFNSATQKLLDKLRRDTEEARSDLKRLKKMTMYDIWESDLEALSNAYAVFIATRLARRSPAEETGSVAPVKRAAKCPKGVSKKRKKPAAPTPP
jgi:DNA topoisomerase-2